MKKVLALLIVTIFVSCGWNDKPWIIKENLTTNIKILIDPAPASL